MTTENKILKSVLDNIEGIVFLIDKSPKNKDIKLLYKNKNVAKFFGKNLPDFSKLTKGHVEQEIGKKLYHFNCNITKLNKNYLITLNDITEHKEYIKQCSEVEAAKESFFINVSHELRTPLNGVLGITELLLDTNLDNEQKNYLSTIHKSTENFIALLNDVFDLTRLESRNIKLKRKIFDLNIAAFEIYKKYENCANSKNLKYEFDCPESINNFEGDLYRVKQIIDNLLSNAVKFTHKGKVNFKVKVTKGKTKDYKNIIFNISDSGIGIDKKNFDFIFTKFGQVDCLASRQYGGTGLGLAIVKRLTELMGGEVKLTSKINKGTEFTINLPLKIAAKNSVAINKDNLIENEQEINLNIDTKVLVVDDHPVNTRFLEKALNKLGLDYVDIAESGMQAIEKVRAHRYDIIFMDLQMPVMDGYETTKIIRKLEEDKKIKPQIIIAATANSLDNDKEHCIEIGMNDYMSKPIKANVLIKFLLKWQD